jgi:CheY-like chemotaxis protein
VSGPAHDGGRTVRILAVEDDVDVLSLLSRLLSSVGNVRIARDGLEAWQTIEQGFVPDLIVTDVMMPRMDGNTLVQKLKADPRFSRIPVIMLTAKSAPRDVIAGINTGARHYVTKPFSAEDLLGKVKKTLGSK